MEPVVGGFKTEKVKVFFCIGISTYLTKLAGIRQFSFDCRKRKFPFSNCQNLEGKI